MKKSRYLILVLACVAGFLFFLLNLQPIDEGSKDPVAVETDNLVNFNLPVSGSSDGMSVQNGSGALLTQLGSIRDTVALKGPHDVKWSPDGNYAAIAGKFGSLAVVSVDVNGTIKIEAKKTIENDPELDDAQTVEWSANGKYVFVGAKDHFLSYFWDGSTLSKVGAASDEKLEQINGIYLVGNYAVAASKINYIHVIDISDPESPTIRDNYNTRVDGLIAPHDVVGWSDYIAVADQRKDTDGKLYVYKILNSGKLLSAANWKLQDSLHHDDMNGANRLEMYNSQVYVMNNYSHTVSVVDVSNPMDIRLTGIFDAGDNKGPSGSTIYHGKWLLVANDDSIVVFDVGDANEARIVAQYQFGFLTDSSGSGHDLSIADGLGIATGQADNTIFTFRLNTDRLESRPINR